MREKKNMLNKILSFAKSDQRVRAVTLSGSRANPNIPADPFQDFDITYFVTDVNSFIQDRKWIENFGEVMILQTPDLMQESVHESFQSFAFLMQFMDGNRIDLRLSDASKITEFNHESLTKPLLDKDNILPFFAEPCESDYRVRPPSEKEFADCCNEFWWVSTYIAKGLWRNQLVYYKHMQDQIVRPELIRMISWYIGTKTGFQCNLGGYGKNITHYLEPELVAMLERSYSGCSRESSWDALFAMGDLFRLAGRIVAGDLRFQYPEEEDLRVSAYLKHVRRLPASAGSLY